MYLQKWIEKICVKNVLEQVLSLEVLFHVYFLTKIPSSIIVIQTTAYVVT